MDPKSGFEAAPLRPESASETSRLAATSLKAMRPNSVHWPTLPCEHPRWVSHQQQEQEAIFCPGCGEIAKSRVRSESVSAPSCFLRRRRNSLSVSEGHLSCPPPI